MISIDDAYKLVQDVANKRQRGVIPPEQFNRLAKICQIEVISETLGPPFGYAANRKINEMLRPLMTGPVEVPIQPNGNFEYPYGYIWPDSVSKLDFRPITIVAPDEYPGIKHSPVIPPTSEYPVCVFMNPYGFIDPYSIGSFKMTYLKRPPDPVWGYDVVNDEPVYNPATSVNFTISDDFSVIRISVKILQYVGINLSDQEVAQFGFIKDKQGT